MIELVEPLEKAVDRKEGALAEREVARRQASKCLRETAEHQARLKRKIEECRAVLSGIAQFAVRVTSAADAAARRLRGQIRLAEAQRIALTARKTVRDSVRTAVGGVQATGRRARNGWSAGWHWFASLLRRRRP